MTKRLKRLPFWLLTDRQIKACARKLGVKVPVNFPLAARVRVIRTMQREHGWDGADVSDPNHIKFFKFESGH